jgi:hypothetical protein
MFIRKAINLFIIMILIVNDFDSVHTSSFYLFEYTRGVQQAFAH